MDALSNLKLKSGGSGDFIKFEADKTIKIRVHSVDPMVANDNFGNTVYYFAVWEFGDAKPMILPAKPSIVRPLQELHTDEDFGADITKLDIKIIATGTGMERRYQVAALPTAVKLTTEQSELLKDLDAKLDSVIKNGIRASQFNDGAELPNSELEIISDDDALNQVFPGNEVI